MWNEKCELRDRSYSVSNIQDYDKHVMKFHNIFIDNPPIRIYLSNIEIRFPSKIKKICYLEFLAPETIELLGSTRSKITKDGNGENVPYLKITEAVHCNVVNNDYQHNSKVLYIFVPNKSFGQLLYISPKNFIFLENLFQSFHIVEYGLLIKILDR